MKGLIIKEILCMKKQLFMFLYITIGVIVISIMFILSANHGNIHHLNQQMILDGEMDENELSSALSYAMVCFFVLPLACIGDISSGVMNDRKMGFNNVAAAFPISRKKRVLAKFISSYVLFVVGGLVDVVLSVILSMLTDQIQFLEFMNMICMLVGILVMLSSLNYLFLFLLGSGKELLANVIPTIILTIVFAGIIIRTFQMGGGSEETANILLSFPRKRGATLLLFSIGINVLSYFTCVWLAEKKRGLI